MVGHGDRVGILMRLDQHGGGADHGIVVSGEMLAPLGRAHVLVLGNGTVTGLRIEVVEPCGELFGKSSRVDEHKGGAVGKHLIEHAALDGRPYRFSGGAGVEHVGERLYDLDFHIRTGLRTHDAHRF